MMMVAITSTGETIFLAWLVFVVVLFYVWTRLTEWFAARRRKAQSKR